MKARGVPEIAFVQGGFSNVGGIESFASDLLFALDSRGVPVRLICWDAGGAEPVLSKFENTGISVHRTDWRWGCRWGWPDRIMASRQWRHLEDADLLVFGKLLHEEIHHRLLRVAKRKILITPYRPAEMWRLRRPDDAVLNSFDAIVVQAAPFEQDLRTLGYRGRVVVLPYLPPPISEVASWPPTGLLQIGFLGRLVPDKNVQHLLLAFSRLREMGTESRLHIYGDGPERNALEQLTAELGLLEQVRFHGNRRRSEIATAIDRCHLFAFSSITEGQCMAALEILARGRPIVGTPVGAFPDFLQGALGCIAPLDDPQVYAGALRSIGNRSLERRVQPEDVQLAYGRRFNRGQVMDDYMRLFGCYKDDEVQIA